VDLFYSTRKADPEILERLTDIAEAAGVTLHVTETTSAGTLTDAHLREAVPGFAQASVWFCGPGAFGDTLRRGLVAHGLSERCFHQEMFEFR